MYHYVAAPALLAAVVTTGVKALRAGRGLRVGVVGCGYWGAKHLRVLMSTPGVSDVVAIDDCPGRLAAVHDALPGVRIAVSLADGMRNIDAAVVATPVHTHAAVAAELIDAGKHVLVEKPMTATTAEARMLIDLAYERGVVLMAGHTFEYNAAVQMLRELIRSDELGSVYYVDTARLNLGIYRTDVNVIWDLAAHDISIINLLLGAGPTDVQAWGSRHATSGQEDVGYVRLGYGNLGVTAQLHVSWLDPCKVRRVTVVGSKRMAVYNDLDDEKRLRVYDKGILVDDCPSGDVPLSYRYGGISCPHIDFSEPLANEDAHFVSCVVAGISCQTDGYSGLAVVQALEAADLSLHSGEPIALEASSPAGLPELSRLTSVG